MKLQRWLLPPVIGGIALGVIMGGGSFAHLDWIWMAGGVGGGFAFSATHPRLQELGVRGEVLACLVCLGGYIATVGLIMIMLPIDMVK